MTQQGTGAGPMLDDDDAAVASLLGLRMMAADSGGDPTRRDRGARLEARAIVVGDLLERLAWAGPSAPAWRRDVARRLAAEPTRSAGLRILDDVVGAAGRLVPTRRRRLAVLIHLVTFEPWPVGVAWDRSSRARALAEIVDGFEDVTRADLAGLEDERRTLERRVRGGSVVHSDDDALDAIRVGLHTGAVLLGEDDDLDAARLAARSLARRCDEVTLGSILLATERADRGHAGASLRARFDREQRDRQHTEDVLRAVLHRLRELGLEGDGASRRR